MAGAQLGITERNPVSILLTTTPRGTVVRVGVVLCAALVAALGARVAAAAAAPCGATDPSTRQPARGKLTLDEQSATSRDFKRSTKPGTLSLIYSISGCDLAAADPRPNLLVIPAKGGNDIPDGVLTYKNVEVDGSTLFVILRVDAQKMDPGSYAGIVILQAPYLASNRTPIGISRSEDRTWRVLGAGALAALLGLLWLLVPALAARTTLAISPWRLVPLCLLALGAGVVAGATNYFSQDVWTFGDNFRSMAGAAFVAASSGAIAVAVLGAAAQDKKAPGKRGPGAKRADGG